MNSFIKTFMLLVLFINPTAFLFGQTDVQRKNQIKISPLRIINMVNPGIELSYERFHGVRYSSQLSVGYMTEIFNTTQFENYKGFKLSFEEKYFLKRASRNRNYFSVEFDFLRVNYDDASYFKNDTASAAYLDSFAVAKKTFSLNIKRGVQKFFNRWLLDLSIGLGLKYKMVNKNGIQNPNAFEQGPRHPNVYQIANEEGNYFTGNIPVAIKVGYKF